MDQSLRAQIETYLSHLRALIQRGQEVRDTLTADPASKSAIAAVRAWHEDCGVTINQLSGGSKAHWLARAFSEAFLMRGEDGRAVEGTPPTEIVTRLIGVLQQAIKSLTQTNDGAISSASSQAPAPHRFDFVHNLELRPVLEQAFNDSKQALEDKDYEFALLTSCGILEAIVTDALEFKGVEALADAPAGKIADWPFGERLSIAERMGLIRGGCARLPAVARAYREVPDDGNGSQRATVTERDARTAGQVLHVVMRDLDPGR